MANWKQNLFLLLLLSFVAACNTASKVPSSAEPESTADRAAKKKQHKQRAEKGSAVYVYRPTKLANAMLTPELSLPGVKKIPMANGVCRKIYMPPGVYAVKLHAIEGVTEAIERDLEITKGKVHYLRVDASMKLNAGQQGYQPYKRKFKLETVSAKQAKKGMTGCKEMDNSIDPKPLSDSVEKDDSGFSVGKTQNPFSH